MCGSVHQFNRDEVRAVVADSTRLIDAIRQDGQGAFYSVYRVRKKRGKKYRLISAPEPALKDVQRRLAHVLKLPVHVSAAGFIENQSILHNALRHATAAHLLNVDFADFFASVSDKMVGAIFEKNGLGDLSDALLMLVTKDGSLPTGAPTSPVLSNAVCFDFDSAMYRYARENGLTFTRYVDDITLSSNEYIPPSVLEFLQQCAQSHKFRLNPKKTRYSSRRRNLMVTGLVINNDPTVYHHVPRIPRNVMRRIRALVHKERIRGSAYCNATGKPLESKLSSVISGYIAWARGINPLQASKIERWRNAFVYEE